MEVCLINCTTGEWWELFKIVQYLVIECNCVRKKSKKCQTFSKCSLRILWTSIANSDGYSCGLWQRYSNWYFHEQHFEEQWFSI
jgi:hypothetical protein